MVRTKDGMIAENLDQRKAFYKTPDYFQPGQLMEVIGCNPNTTAVLADLLWASRERPE
jgi:hypothetical protein